MDGRAQVMIGIEDSGAAEIVAIEAVRLLGDHPGRRWVLYHMMPPEPPRRRPTSAWHAAHLARQQQRRELARRHGHDADERAASHTARRVRAEMQALGVADHRIASSLHWPAPDETLEGALHAAAAAQDCDAVVVGRHAFPWFWEISHHHTAEELMDLPASGHAVLIVPLADDREPSHDWPVRPSHADPESGPIVSRLLFLADDPDSHGEPLARARALAQRHDAELLLAHAEAGTVRQVTELAVREHADLVVIPHGHAAAVGLARAATVPLLILPATLVPHV